MIDKLVEKMSEITTPLLEQNFPKRKCKERSAALLLHAQIVIAIATFIREEYANFIREKYPPTGGI